MIKDPISVIFRLTGLANEKSLSEQFKQKLVDLKTKQKSIKLAEADKWHQFYSEALELCYDLRNYCSTSLDNTGTGEEESHLAANQKTDLTEQVANVKNTIPMMEKAMRSSVNYVKTSRLDRQKESMLSQLKEAVSQNSVEVDESANSISVSLASSWKKQFTTYVDQALNSWANASISGLTSRIHKEWDMYQPDFDNALKALKVEQFHLAETRVSKFKNLLTLPGSIEEKKITFGAAFSKILRSTLGMIMMGGGMVVGLAGPAIGMSKGEAKSMIFLFIIPIVGIIAGMMAKNEVVKHNETLEDKLTSSTKADVNCKIEKAVNDAYKRIKGSIERFSADQERAWSGWKHKANTKMAKAQRNTSAALTPAPRQEVPNTRLKYVLEDLDQKIISGIEARLNELAG